MFIKKPLFLQMNSSESEEDEESPLRQINKAIQKNEEYQKSLIEMLQIIENRIELNNLKLDLYEYLKKQKKNSYKRRFWYDQIAFYPFDEVADRIPEPLRILKLIRNQQKKRNISNFLSKVIQEIDDKFDEIDEDDFLTEICSSKNNKSSLIQQPNLNEYIAQLPKKDPKEINWVLIAKKLNAEALKSHNNTNSSNNEFFFSQKISSAPKPILITGLHLYKSYMSFHELHKPQTDWTKEDDDVLWKAVMMHGTDDWKQISNYLDGKDTGSCFQRWYKYVNPSITKGKWTLFEDVKLVLYLEYFGKGKWCTISKKFSNRTDVQIRERWCNILDPHLKHSSRWYPEEDEILIKEASLNNFKWSQIATKFKGRTDNQCSRRYKTLITRNFRKLESKKRIIKMEKKEKMEEKIDDFGGDEEELLERKKYSLKEALLNKLPIFTIVRQVNRQKKSDLSMNFLYK